MEKRILTVQDVSCVGQCSLTVALPIISACGIETAILPTGILSTHTANFTGFTVLSMTDEIAKIMRHWESEKITFDAIYTGYILKDQMSLIGELCKKFNKGYKIIDPVMADNGNFYYGFDEKFAKEMLNLCKNADIILPNLTEAAFLLGETPVLEGYDEKYIIDLVKKLAEKTKAKNVVLTGVSFDPSLLGVAVYKKGDKAPNYYFGEKISRNFHGTGDIYSSAFVGAFLNGKSVFESAKIAVDFTIKCMKNTISDADKHVYGVFFEQILPYLAESINK